MHAQDRLSKKQRRVASGYYFPVSPVVYRLPWKAAAIFLGPALLLFVGFTLYPILRVIYNSFFVLHEATEYEFVGFQNFRQIFGSDDILPLAVQHSLVWAVFAPFVEITIAFFLALALFAKVPGARLFRVVWLAPVLLSDVVIGMIWVWLYDYNWGGLNVFLRGVGLGSLAHPWLGNPRTALPALIVVGAWAFTGFKMVVLLAALGAIPPSLVEAARIDGAGWWREMSSILLPLVRRTIVNLLVLSFIGKMKLFGLVYIMTGGGPLWATETVATYIVKRAFYWKTFDLGYPSAIATLWFLLMLLFVGMIMLVGRRQEQLEF
jgi:multiple sugar transport system permease protein/raffinose/stachyose/melibiose transport system permease protein